MNKEVDAAVEALKKAIRRQDPFDGLTIVTFMGLTPKQIKKLIGYYEEHTGKASEDL